jgi:hypothetical protein
MLFTHKLTSDNFTLKMLPMSSVREIQAIITASKVLKNIGQIKFSNIEIEKVQNLLTTSTNSKKQLEEILNAA